MRSETDLIGELALDCLPDQPRRVGAVELVDGDDPGRRCDIDLGQPLATDHVDADEQQATPLQLGTQPSANLLLALRELALRGLSADREVRADFSFTRYAVD